VAEASLDANKAMSDFDPSSVQSLLNRQKEKVDTMEAEAMGYQNVSNSNKSSEDVVNDLLAADSPTENNKLLTDFLSK
jgi:phage shock protein A